MTTEELIEVLKQHPGKNVAVDRGLGVESLQPNYISLETGIYAGEGSWEMDENFFHLYEGEEKEEILVL